MKFELDVFRQITDALLADEKKNPVVPPISPDQILSILDLELSQQGITDEEFVNALQELILKSPRTTTSGFFNQLFGGRNARATLGDLLAVVMNNAMHTYKVSGPMVEVEKVMVRHICSLLNYDATACGGTIASGGSLTNLMAMLMARDKKIKSAKFEGVTQKMIAYTSEESHYSISKNAAILGIGRDQVRYIETNDKGEMLASALDKAIQNDIDQGFNPFFVNATAGTTVMGAFDPIDEIAEVSQKYNLWLHVDGAYCGSVILSKNYSFLVKGHEKTDSFSLNAHKMLGTPLTSSFILVKDKKDLYYSLDNDANYLFQMNEDEYNLGKVSLQCGRRNDGLKVWTLWKSVGHEGIQQIVDHQFHLAKLGRDYVKNHPDYTLYSNENTLSICFNYKDIPAQDICKALYEDAALMVGYGSFKGTTFVRLISINYGNSDEQILNFFKKLESFVEEKYLIEMT